MEFTWLFIIFMLSELNGHFMQIFSCYISKTGWPTYHLACLVFKICCMFLQLSLKSGGSSGGGQIFTRTGTYKVSFVLPDFKLILGFLDQTTRKINE